MGIKLKRLNPAGPAQYGSKQWLEDQLVIAIDMGLRGRPASARPQNPQPLIPRNPALAVTAIMALARLKGFIIEKKQSFKAAVDLSKMSPADLNATLVAMADQLAPGERQRILEIAAGAEEIE